MKTILAFFAAMAAMLHDRLFGFMVGSGMVLQMASVMVKPPVARRNVGSESGGPATNLGKIKINLDRSFLVEEHVLEVFISQTFGTNAPSSADARDAFSLIELVSDRFGTLISAPFAQVYDIARFTENTPSPTFTAGGGGGAAATLRFFVDIHHELDEATFDWITNLQTSEHGSLYLQLTCADNADNCFKGGTGTLGTAAYSVSVDEKAAPAYSGQDIVAAGVRYGIAHQKLISLDEQTGINAVANKQVSLVGGGHLRFLVLHAIDTNATPDAYANGILDEITSLEIGGIDYCKGVTAEALQANNIARRGFNVTGVYVIDFGDDPRRWPFVDGDIKLKFRTESTAPATWKIRTMAVMAMGVDAALGA